MPVDPQSIKQLLAQRHEEIAGGHRNGAGGFATCTSLTGAMDDLVRSAYEMLPTGPKDEIALLALGGYGRGELCPHSDIDVMALCPSGRSHEMASEAARAFLHVLWDAGITVGHSVRTIEETLQTHGSAIDSWASILESRFICGNRELSQELYARVKQTINEQTDTWFTQGVIRDIESRHFRFGSSVKLLEPNIKKSAGGLRDIHSIFWLYRSSIPAYYFEKNSNESMTSRFLELLGSHDTIDDEEARGVLAAYEFLLRTRHAMHYSRNSLHDTLEYALQLEVAEELGYGAKAELRSVEVFMRDYYLHARAIHRLHRRLVNAFREELAQRTEAPFDGQAIGDCFLLRDDVLTLDGRLSTFSRPQQLFESFVYAAENEAEMDFRLRGAVERSIDLVTPDVWREEGIAALFKRILHSRKVAGTLSQMNELGVLERFIPEFGNLVAFFQHNVYHYFTADEHTLVAIANAEHLRDGHGVLREVFRNLKRKDTLYMAILLHDIGKPRGVGDHEVTGVEMAREILGRLAMSDIYDDVGFLIRNHLVMEQIAFRRNIHDPVTIRDFAAKFQCAEQLDYLYVLTYADLSAVNVNVWTEWKASMLQDLYMRTSEVLRRNLKGVQVDEFHQSRREAAEDRIINGLSALLPRAKVERHLRGIQSEAYTSTFSETEIARHIERIDSNESVSMLCNHSEGYTEITVIARDTPFALSRFCAVLSANDANIFDANVFTRDDGIIIDRFRVGDATSKQRLDQKACNKIAGDLTSVMEGGLDIRHLFDAHQRRWKRKTRKPANPNIRIGVEFEDNPRFTILDVYAQDMVGFLYRITETISRLGLDIYFAKIATRVDGIVDAFYILDRSRNPVKDPVFRDRIRSEILDTIRTLQEQELV